MVEPMTKKRLAEIEAARFACRRSFLMLLIWVLFLFAVGIVLLFALCGCDPIGPNTVNVSAPVTLAPGAMQINPATGMITVQSGAFQFQSGCFVFNFPPGCFVFNIDNHLLKTTATQPAKGTPCNP